MRCFVAVDKGMVLDDEIEQVRGLEFAAGIQRLAEHGLVDVAENGGQGLAALLSEQRRGLPAPDQIIFQTGNGHQGSIMIQNTLRWPAACG